MPGLVPVTGVGAQGINRDTEAILLPPNAWSDGRNVRFSNGSVEKISGHESILQVSQEPTALLYWARPTSPRYIYAATTALYQLLPNNTVQVLNASGVTYSATGDWQLSPFNGGYTVIANNGIDIPQYITYGTEGQPNQVSFQDLPDWPTTLSAGTVRSFGYNLIAGNLTDRSGAVVNHQPGTIRVSSQAAPGFVPSSWTVGAALLTTADEFELSTGGRVLEIVGLKNTAMVFTDNSIHLVRPATTRGATQVDNLNYGKGVLAPDCAIEIDGEVFAVDKNDIYVTNGSGAIRTVADGKMRDYFFTNLNATHYENTFVLRNLAQDEIWIVYPTVTSTGPCNEAIIWNYVDDTWTIRDMPDSLAGTIGPSTNGTSFEEGEDNILFTGFGAATTTNQQEITASGTQSNQTIGGQAASFTYLLSGASNTVTDAVAEVQNAAVSGSVSAEVPAIDEVQQLAVSGSLAGSIAGRREIQQAAITGTLDPFTSGIAEVQRATITGSLDAPISGVSEVQTASVTGSLMGTVAAIAEVQTLTVAGSLAGASTGSAEIQDLGYTGTRSNVVSTGTSTSTDATIGLPTDFNTGAAFDSGVVKHYFEIDITVLINANGTNNAFGIFFEIDSGSSSTNDFLTGTSIRFNDIFATGSMTIKEELVSRVPFRWPGSGDRQVEFTNFDANTNILSVALPIIYNPNSSFLDANGFYNISFDFGVAAVDNSGMTLPEVTQSYRVSNDPSVATTGTEILLETPPRAPTFTFTPDANGVDFTGSALGEAPGGATADQALTSYATAISNMFPTITSGAISDINSGGVDYRVITLSIPSAGAQPVFVVSENAGFNTTPFLQSQVGTTTTTTGGGMQSIYQVLDYQNREVTMFSSSVSSAGSSDLNTVLNRIASAVNNNAETPVDFTAVVDTTNSRIVLTGQSNGNVSGMWAVNITHSNAEGFADGDLAFTTTVRTEGVADTPAENLTYSITETVDGSQVQTYERTITGNNSGVSSATLTTTIRQQLNSLFSGWTTTGSGSNAVLTRDAAGDVNSTIVLTSSSSNIAGTFAVTTNGVDTIPPVSASATIDVPGGNDVVVSIPGESDGVTSSEAAAILRQAAVPGWTLSGSGSNVIFTNNSTGAVSQSFAIAFTTGLAASVSETTAGITAVPGESVAFSITPPGSSAVSYTVTAIGNGFTATEIVNDIVSNVDISGWTLTNSSNTLIFTADSTGAVTDLFLITEDNAGITVGTVSASTEGTNDVGREDVSFNVVSPEGVSRTVIIPARTTGSSAANIAADLAAALTIPLWTISNTGSAVIFTSNTNANVFGTFLVSDDNAGVSTVVTTTQEGAANIGAESSTFTVIDPAGNQSSGTIAADAGGRTASEIASAMRTQLNFAGWTVSGSGINIIFTNDAGGVVNGVFSSSFGDDGLSTTQSTATEGVDRIGQGSTSFSFMSPEGVVFDHTPLIPTTGLTAAQIATELRANLVVPGWTVGGSGSNVVFTKAAAGSSPGVFTVSIVNTRSSTSTTITTTTEGAEAITASTFNITTVDGAAVINKEFSSAQTTDQIGTALAAALTNNANLAYNSSTNVLTITFLTTGQQNAPVLTIENDSRNSTPFTATLTSSSASGSDPTAVPSLYTVTLPSGFSPSTVSYSAIDQTVSQVIAGIRNAINVVSVTPVDVIANIVGSVISISWSDVSTSDLFAISVDNQGGAGNVTFGTASAVAPDDAASNHIHLGDISTQFNGSNFTAFIERRRMDMGDLEAAKWTNSVYPVASGAGILQINVEGTNAAGSAVEFPTNKSFNFDISDDYKIDARNNGRFFHIKFSSNSSDAWTLSKYSIKADIGDRR